MKMDKIIKAKTLNDYKIEILTSSGISGIFELKPYLHGIAFKELTDISYFRLVRPAYHGIIWPTNKILAPTLSCGIFKMPNTTRQMAPKNRESLSGLK